MDKVYVVTPYISEDIDNKNTSGSSGIAVYAHTLFVKTLVKNHKVVLLADYITQKSRSKHKDVVIHRMWSQTKPLDYFKTLDFIPKNSKVIINYDFTAFGGTLSRLFFPLFLLFLRIKTKNIIHIQHSVMWDMKSFAKHLGIENSKLLQMVYSMAIKLNLIIFSWLVKYVVVLEGFLRNRYALLPFVNSTKIKFVPLLVEKVQALERSKETKKFTVTFFGFLTWYKGVDYLLRAVNSKDWNKQIRLIIAGGKSPNDANNYYAKILRKIKKVNNLPYFEHTGFVPENKIPELFRKTQVLVLPYRIAPSSSGPLAVALAYKVPFILSTKMQDYLQSDDFVKAMRKVDLKKHELFFPLNTQSIINHINLIYTKPNLYAKLQKFVNVLSKYRSVAVVQHTILSLFN